MAERRRHPRTTWTAQINDGHGIQGAEQLTITIGGTLNDIPTIDASTNLLDIAELGGDSSAQDIAPTTGTITFTDQDLGDFPSPVTPPPLHTSR